MFLQAILSTWAIAQVAKFIGIRLPPADTIMPLPLPPDLQQFADRQIASGKYMAEQEQIYQGRFEELRREVLLGVLEAERGKLLDATSQIEAVRQRLRDRHVES